MRAGVESRAAGDNKGAWVSPESGASLPGGDWNPNKLNLGPLPLPFPGPSSEEEDPRLKGKRWPLTGTESGPVPDGHRQLRDGGGGAAAAGGKQPSGRLSPGSALGSARLKETAAAAVKGGVGWGMKSIPQYPLSQVKPLSPPLMLLHWTPTPNSWGSRVGATPRNAEGTGFPEA